MRYKVLYVQIFEEFLSQYPLINKKFKINKKYFPNPYFERMDRT